MNITESRQYLYLYRDLTNCGFTDAVVVKLLFSNQNTDQCLDLLNHLENCFKLYQYKKDNGIKYGQHELFFWCNGNYNYFTIDLNADSLENHMKLFDRVINLLTTKYNSYNFDVVLQYGQRTNFQRIHEFMQQDFDINNLPLNKLSSIVKDVQRHVSDYVSEDILKASNLLSSYINQFVDKKVIVNDVLKGNLVRQNDEFRLFKPRATRTYYPITCDMIKQPIQIYG